MASICPLVSAKPMGYVAKAFPTETRGRPPHPIGACDGRTCPDEAASCPSTTNQGVHQGRWALESSGARLADGCGTALFPVLLTLRGAPVIPAHGRCRSRAPAVPCCGGSPS